MSLPGKSAEAVIRAARRRDLDAIAALQARSIMALGIETYGEEACEAWARMGRQVRHTLLDSGTFFVAEQDGGLVGVAGWTLDSREPDCAWARYVFVAPEAGRLGIGRRLMAVIERSADAAGRSRMMLWSSLNALGFYEALGYRRVRSARWPIGDGIEMEHVLMERKPVGEQTDRRL